MNEMRSIFLRSIFIGPLLLTCHAGAQEHRFEDDPIVAVRENFVACDVLSQLQRVMGNPRFLLAGECEPLRQEIRSASTRGVDLISAFIRTTGRRPANGRTRRRYRNERERPSYSCDPQARAYRVK